MKKFLFFGILLVLIHALFGAASATEPTNVSDPICNTPATVYDPFSFDNLIEGLDSMETLRLDGHYWDNTLVINCTIHDTGGDGIFIKNVDNVVIQNCEIYNVGNGIKTSSVGGSTNVVIDGCFIHEVSEDGIKSNQHFPNSIDSPGIIIRNNRITNVGLGQSGYGRHPICIQTQDFLIENNTIYGARHDNGISIRSSGIVRCNTVSGTSELNKHGIRYFSDNEKGPSNLLVIEHNNVVSDAIGIDLYKPAVRKYDNQPPPDHVVKNFIIRYNSVVASTPIHVDSAYDDPIYSVQVYDNQTSPYVCGILEPDGSPPTEPGELLATPVSDSQIDLIWEAAIDHESGVSYYKIYRDGAVVSQTSSTSYSDTRLTENTTYAYEVSAVNCQELESELRAPESATTFPAFSDTIPPTIVSVEALDDPYKVIIVYSKPVEVLSATAAINYDIDNGISISAASLGADSVTVTLTTSELSPDITYILTVNSVADRAVQPNIIVLNTQATFTFVPVMDEATILSTMRLVNDYWINGHTSPGDNRWARSAYFTGNMALYDIYPAQEYLDYALLWANNNNWGLNGGTSTRNADNQCAGQTYLDLYDIDSLLLGIEDITASVENMVYSQKVDDWWWIDALYMAMPVFTRLGVIYNNPDYFSKMYDLYYDTKTRRGLYNQTDGLWYRDEDFDPPSTTPNGLPTYWSRGNGWVFGAHARTLQHLPIDDPHRDEYISTFQAMAAALKDVQRTDGFWNVSLADPDDYPGPETSGTSFFTYGMAWGINNGFLDAATYLPVVIKAWKGMVDIAVHPDGKLGYVQCTGKEPSSCQPFSYDSTTDFGVGAFLLAGSEMYKLSSGTFEPIAVLSADPTSGEPPLTVTFDGSDSFDPDGTITSYFWDFGDGQTSTGANLTHTYSDAGTYIATLTVTNDEGDTDTDSVAITVTLPPKVHVEEIFMEIRTVGKKHLAGTAQVTVLDSGDGPVVNATVTGMWSGLVSGTQTGLTGSDGIATFESAKVSKSATGIFVFTVTGVTASGFTYDPDANIVESGCIDTQGSSCTPEPPGGVQNLEVSAVDVVVNQVRKHWRGEASVTVVDKDAPANKVAGAMVTGYWEFEQATGSTTVLGSESAGTGQDGVAVLLSPKRRAVSGDIFRFTVTDVTLPGATYDSLDQPTGSGMVE